MKKVIIGILSLTPLYSLAQEDTLSMEKKKHQLSEVLIISPTDASESTDKPLANLDEYLNDHGHINMVRRGAYAWEANLNGMSSERNVMTIDGMRIFGACTDKMDPISSYVEITNLAEAEVSSSSLNAKHSGALAGSIDLKQAKIGFGRHYTKGNVMTGFEHNNLQKIAGAGLYFAREKFYFDLNASFRDAANYKAGKGEEILYSQFRKMNIAAQSGVQLSEHQELAFSFIYDRATDIGYPALPMDVSLAEAFIASVAYVRHHIHPRIDHWETKFYYNDITHIMDDTKRPVVPIRMDMPGWSKTGGLYSKLLGNFGQHHWEINAHAYQNYSYAEMTMYPNDPNEADMFMLTWPGVRTNDINLYIGDTWYFKDKWSLNMNASLAYHQDYIKDNFGYESLKIFYPEIEEKFNKLLKNIAVSVSYDQKSWYFNLGLSHAERAATVSEGYGFYLFNSFDGYDYIGNPYMKNEKANAINLSTHYKEGPFKAAFSTSYFLMQDYIIGKIAPELSPMNIGIKGVKVYESLDFAHIFNAVLDLDYAFHKNWNWTNQFSYRRGFAQEVGDLPMMQPFEYRGAVSFYKKGYLAKASVVANSKQTKINPDFGEQALDAYWIANISLSKDFQIGKHVLAAKLGVENILDRHYTTYADWNRIPQMGRNIFANLIWKF